MRRLCMLLVVSSLLSACTLPIIGTRDQARERPQVEDRPPVVEPGQRAPEPYPATEAPSTIPAGLQRLLNRADDQIASGALPEALATLERALRIAPQSTVIYLRMADIYQQLGQRDQAINIAQRGLLYCKDTIDCNRLRARANE